MTTFSTSTKQCRGIVKKEVSSARATSPKKFPVESATTMLPHIVAFDDLISSSRSFASRYLEVAACSAGPLHQHLCEQMLDLIEDQLIVYITYRYWAQYALSQQRTGLVLKEGDAKPTRSSLISDVLTLARSDEFINGDDATHAFLRKAESLLVKEAPVPTPTRGKRNNFLCLQSLSTEGVSIGGDSTEDCPYLSEGTVFACLRKAASETAVKHPDSAWLRCIGAMLSLDEEANRCDSSLGFLDALLLLRRLERREMRVLLLKTVMQYCEV